MGVGQLLVIVTAVAAGAAILWPLRGARTARRPARADSALEVARDAKLREITELELDYRLGKLSAEDYEELRRALRSEAVEIIRRIDAVAPAPGVDPAHPPDAAA